MKNTQKHTDGPWSYHYKSAAQARAEIPGTDGGGSNGFVQKRKHHGAYPQNIAFMPHNRDVSKDEEMEANARLISAAPDLLAVLLSMVEQFGHYCEHTEDAKEIQALVTARAALAKAEGVK